MSFFYYINKAVGCASGSQKFLLCSEKVSEHSEKQVGKAAGKVQFKKMDIREIRKAKCAKPLFHQQLSAANAPSPRAVMERVSTMGYRMFPLPASGYAGAFQRACRDGLQCRAGCPPVLCEARRQMKPLPLKSEYITGETFRWHIWYDAIRKQRYADDFDY